MTKPDLPTPTTKAEAMAYIEAWHRLNPAPDDDRNADATTKTANLFTHSLNTLDENEDLLTAVKLLSF